MRSMLPFFFVVLGASCGGEPGDEVNNLSVSALQSSFEAGVWSGKTRAGPDRAVCTARVTHGIGDVREITIELSSADDASVATFYANGGRTMKIDGSNAGPIDMTAKADGERPRSWHVRAERFGDEFTFIEITETRDGAATTKKCISVTKS